MLYPVKQVVVWLKKKVTGHTVNVKQTELPLLVCSHF